MFDWSRERDRDKATGCKVERKPKCAEEDKEGQERTRINPTSWEMEGDNMAERKTTDVQFNQVFSLPRFVVLGKGLTLLNLGVPTCKMRRRVSTMSELCVTWTHGRNLPR